MGDVLFYTLQTFAPLYLMIVLLRFMLQMVRADFYNPISQFVVKATHPLLAPLRRIIPGFRGLDIASLVLAFFVMFVTLLLALSLVGLGDQIANLIPNLIAWTLLGTATMFLNILFYALIASVIISWVARGSRHPFVILINQLIEPLLLPIRRLLPDLGGLDISPIFAFFAINILQRFVIFPIANMTVGEAPQAVITVVQAFVI